MDSPKSCVPTTTSTAETVAAQDSPVFSYISNLSPIQPVKPPPVTQGFPGLNSPPLVFTSPQLNPSRQPTFLRRVRLPELSAKLSGQDEDSKKSVTAVDASENLDVQLNTRLITCDEKVSHSHSSKDGSIESPAGCPDQFLCDVVNTDSGDPNISTDSSVKESENVEPAPDAATVSNESIVKCAYEYNARINEEIAVAPPAIGRELEEEHKRDSPIYVNALETDIKEGDGILIGSHPEIESDLQVDHTLTNPDHYSMTESLRVGKAGPLDQPSYLLPGTVQIEKKNENLVGDTGAVLTKSILKDIQNGPEAFQIHGMLRRCLQFEDALQKVIPDQPAQNPSDSGDAKLQSFETPLTPINGKQAEKIQPMYPGNMCSSKNIPRPSGIGLHLNSIVNGVQAGSDSVVHMKSAQRGNISVWGKKSIPLINTCLTDRSNSSSAFHMPQNVSASTDVNQHEIQTSLAANPATSFSTLIAKPSNNSFVLNPVEDQSTSGTIRKYNNIETEGSSEEFKSSPKRKRKKSSNSSDGDGCKRCNCKKSRCLKLYCDCFAAGIYCAEPCACQDCYNRPEYEDTVLETRKQIESRNPLAFAPKVVQHTIKTPASSCGEDGTQFTPSSARHKRGCNCKKSMCLKKYCECYQANVGCSDGCRCEGCKNVYGQKGEYGMIKEVQGEEGADPHNMTPLTPAIQFLNHRKYASEAQPHSGKHFQSEFTAPYIMYPVSPINSDNNGVISEITPDNNGVISEITPEIMDLASSDQQVCYSNSKTANVVSTVHHQPQNGDLSGVPNPMERASNPNAQSVSESKYCSSVSSLHLKASPNTPMVQFSGAKHRQLVELNGELSNITQDDTPDILKDSPTPLNAVKASSPNKKRVSPPHSRQNELGSSTSDFVRTGRKFILKAVPSFPPLSPCIDFKSIIPQQINDPQNHTRNK